jgi:hypothetical protein
MRFFLLFFLGFTLTSLPAQEVLYQKKTEDNLLKGSDLLKTDQAEVKLQVQDQVQRPTGAFDWTQPTGRESDFRLTSIYRFSDQFSWNNQWQLQANSTLREPDWHVSDGSAAETNPGGFKQQLETSLNAGVPSGPFQFKTFLQRENSLTELNDQNAFILRQGLEASWQAAKWSKVRTEIRQEQSFLENELALQRDILLLNLTQQLGPQPWQLSLTPSFTEESRADNLTLERGSFTRALEQAVRWTPRDKSMLSWGSKLRQTDSNLEQWNEKATGLFTEWQQQLTSRWSALARWEIEKADRTSSSSSTSQEFTRSNLRLQQSWSLNPNLQAQFEISHQSEYERIQSQSQSEQRIGVSLRSAF